MPPDPRRSQPQPRQGEERGYSHARPLETQRATVAGTADDSSTEKMEEEAEIFSDPVGTVVPKTQ